MARNGIGYSWIITLLLAVSSFSCCAEVLNSWYYIELFFFQYRDVQSQENFHQATVPLAEDFIELSSTSTAEKGGKEAGVLGEKNRLEKYLSPYSIRDYSALKRKIGSHMKWSSRLDLVMHVGWVQIIDRRSKRVSPVRIQSKDNPWFPKIKGDVHIYRQGGKRNFSIDLLIHYSLYSPILLKRDYLLTNNFLRMFQDSLTFHHKDSFIAPYAFLSDQDVANNGLVTFRPSQTYQIQEFRWIKQRSLHYFDHPFFGVLLYLSPLDCQSVALLKDCRVG